MSYRSGFQNGENQRTFLMAKIAERDSIFAYYKDPNNSRGRNNSREWKIIQNLIKVGGGIIVGGGKNAEIKCRYRKK